jgi:hypothetical protein
VEDEPLGSLRRVIAVGSRVDLAAGAVLHVTAVEVWDALLLLHAVEQLPEFFLIRSSYYRSRLSSLFTNSIAS